MAINRYRRLFRTERLQRGSYREPDSPKLWGRPALSRNRKDTKVKVSHVANYCLEKIWWSIVVFYQMGQADILDA